MNRAHLAPGTPGHQISSAKGQRHRATKDKPQTSSPLQIGHMATSSGSGGVAVLKFDVGPYYMVSSRQQ